MKSRFRNHLRILALLLVGAAIGVLIGRNSFPPQIKWTEIDDKKVGLRGTYRDFSFSDCTLRQAIGKLSKLYDVPIRIQCTLDPYYFDGDFIGPIVMENVELEQALSAVIAHGGRISTNFDVIEGGILVCDDPDQLSSARLYDIGPVIDRVRASVLAEHPPDSKGESGGGIFGGGNSLTDDDINRRIVDAILGNVDVDKVRTDEHPIIRCSELSPRLIMVSTFTRYHRSVQRILNEMSRDGKVPAIKVHELKFKGD